MAGTRNRLVTGGALAAVIVALIALYVSQPSSRSIDVGKEGSSAQPRVTAAASSPSCEKAARLYREIAPDMTKYVAPFFRAPASLQHDIMRDNPIIVKTLTTMTNEYCPAVLDCGGVPGMPQSDVATTIQMCSGIVKAAKGSQ